ncbi:MAG: substrate-binding domain-containing protein [Armatimonadetes bacterium]|nr:substrate-binding domain-containing protein [Armatimonadota bacterium]
MDEIGLAFEEQYGVAVEYNYTGSGAQLSQIELTEEGDAFMPGAAMYLNTAEEKGFVDYRQNVAYHIPVITVPKGNPANITCLDDLAKPGIELVWGDPEVAAIGKTGIGILEKAGIYEAVWANVVATFPTMNEVMLQISLEQADAAINWWDTVKFDDTIETIQIPREQNDIKLIPIGSLTCSKYPETSRGFVDFCISEQGKAIFEKHGFVTYPDPEYEE